jgi:uncharacterized protein YmfQ (DUF2313 family)
MSDRHVRRSGSDYRDVFLTLLPTGQAWPKHAIDSILFQICDGLCDYWGFVDGRAGDLLEIESDPRATRELLPDWERNWGLPDPCLTDPPTALEERRLALVAKMTMIGGQSRQFFLDVAKAYGYGNITITEYAPYMTGVSRCGDTRWYNPGDPNHYYWELGAPEIRFYWTVHVSALSYTYFHCNSSQCGIDRLLKIGIASDLECILDRLKPAHTQIVYDYTPLNGLDFTQPFNTQYLALGIM